jgi:hypothetical protein
MLDQISDEQLASGKVSFGDAGNLRPLLEKKSPWMRRPFARDGQGQSSKEVKEK